MRWLLAISILCCSLVLAEPVEIVPNRSQPVSLKKIRKRILKKLNSERSRKGARALKFRPELERAAQTHSEEMLQLGYFDHVSPTPGRTEYWDRIIREGYDPTASAENLYKSPNTDPEHYVGDVIRKWMDSSVHRRSILRNRYRRCGLGIAENGKQVYITIVLASE